MAILNSIKAASHSIKYYQSDTFTMTVAITDASAAAVDLSGKELVMQIKKKKTDDAALFELTIDSGLVIGGASNNQITFSGTYDLGEQTYVYDVYNVTDKVTLLYGLFTVVGDVTKE